MSAHLILDFDGVLHGRQMKYGHDRTLTIVERVPIEKVHPALRPRDMRPHSFDGEIPDWVAARRAPKKAVFTTLIKTNDQLLADIAALDVDVTMLTTWLENDAIDLYFDQMGHPFPYAKLTFPARDFADPLGEVPVRWKVDQLIELVERDRRPFVWVDDDEVPMWRAEVEARFPDVPKLMIAPIYDVGITRDHMARIRGFLAAL